MTATARDRSRENCRFVRDLLAEKQPVLSAVLRVASRSVCPRCSSLPPSLRSHAFARSGCELVDGEPVLAARSRGYAAESALDAVTTIREGDLADARSLLSAALTYLDQRDERMVMP